MNEGRYLTHPEAARMFVQERAGAPWVWVGAVDVRNLQVYARQLEYTRLVDEKGVYMVTVPRTPNPPQFDVQFHLNWSKWQAMHASILRRGCLPNFLMVSADCRDSAKIADPNYNNNGLVLYGVDVATAYQFGAGTSIYMDANQATSRKDQIGFVSTDAAWVRDYTFGLQAVCQIGTEMYPNSLAVVDEGECANFVCSNCDNPGAQQWLINDGVNFFYTLDAGATWTLVAASGAGIAQAFNGNAFAVGATAIKLYATLDASAAVWANWQDAQTDVSFAGLCNIAVIDSAHMIVGGTNGAVWASYNGGGNWKRIRTGVAATANWYSFKAIGYNSANKMLVGVGVDAGNNVYVQYSTDRGYSWATVGAALAGKTWAGSSFAQVYGSGPLTYIIVDGDIYSITCALNIYSATQLSLIGASGNITGIGGTDVTNPNSLFLSVWDGSNGKVLKTIDGFNSYSWASLPVAVLNGMTDVNPIAVATSKYGTSLLIAFGSEILWARDWDSFFVQ